MYEVPRLVEKYFQYMKLNKGRADTTLKQYSFDLNKFFKYMLNKTHKDIKVKNITNKFISNITEGDIDEYISSINDKAESTRASRIATLKSFFAYVSNKAKIMDNPTINTDIPEIHRKMPQYIKTKEEQELLISIIDGENKLRDKAIVLLFLNCALRKSELIGLNLNSINNDCISIIRKGGNEQNIPVNDVCIKAINEYIMVRPKADNEALFLSVTDNYLGLKINRITSSNIDYIVKKYLKKANLDNLSTHKLRHTAATRWNENGVDLRVIQELLGHKHITTTEIYTHVSNTRLKDAVNKNSIG